MSYKLFLDDVRSPKTTYSYMELPIYNEPDWIIVRNYYAFITIIEKKGIPDIISFDHDLADIHYKVQDFDYDREDYEKTGYHCAKWLIDYCLDNLLRYPNFEKELPKKIIVHSMNPYGSKNIKSLFDTFYKVYDIQYEPIQMNPYLRL